MQTPSVSLDDVSSHESPPKAIVIAVQTPGVSDAELDSSLTELTRLAKTLGLNVIGRMTQRRRNLAAGQVFGDGKLRELAKLTGGTGEVPRYERPGQKKNDVEVTDEADEPGEIDPSAQLDDEASAGTNEPSEETTAPLENADIVLVDHDLTPTQQRNLELATGAEVHDRTSIIISIFHRHARSRAARLQVEIARLNYQAPRLREGGGGGDRVRGGVGGKGAGESSLELDRRRIRDRIVELKRELSDMEGVSDVQRGRRDSLPLVALVGYTNAGKSSLMRGLTGRETYIADKLFATLDTTVRVLIPRTEPPILVSDTVGFIKKLPHDLVASFHSTLQEAAHADLILHVVDASDPAFRTHMHVTKQVLGEVGAKASPTWLVFNKIDLLSEETLQALRGEFPDALTVSAKRADDTAVFRERIVENFLGAMEDTEFVVPWAAHGMVHQIHKQCNVLSETHEDEGTRLQVRAPSKILERLRALAQAN